MTKSAMSTTTTTTRTITITSSAQPAPAQLPPPPPTTTTTTTSARAPTTATAQIISLAIKTITTTTPAALSITPCNNNNNHDNNDNSNNNNSSSSNAICNCNMTAAAAASTAATSLISHLLSYAARLTRQHKQQQQQQQQKQQQQRLVALPVSAWLLLLLINISCATAAVHRPRNTNLEAKVGSHVVFNCYIDFPYDSPIPYVVHWSRDQHPLNKKIFTWYEGEVSTSDLYAGRLHLVHGHAEYGKASVNLTAIRESDQGWYHCQIIFPNRTPNARNNGTWYYLAVQGGSLIKIPPVNQTIMEGQTAIFHCAMKYPDTSVVSWFKDGALLHDVQDLVRRSYIGKDGSLSIDPTMMSDLGEYECNVRNEDDDEVQTAKAFLNIQYKAKVIYAPPEVYLPYGQPAVLDCHFRANPPLKNLRWEKDGLLFDSYNVPGVFYKMNGSLFFSKVDENDAGSYTCTPYNDLGTDGPSPVISVIVLRPPIFSITPKAIYIQKLGETAQMPCEAIDRDGNNRPTIVWARKDGRTLATERHTITTSHLTITNLIESDRGMYECSATNEAATITTETELMIENIAPRPPYNLTAASTETSITIRWLPDNRYLSLQNPNVGYLRPNLEYTVWYRLTEAPEWRTLRILQQNVMEAHIPQLMPGREYEFMVLSQDKYGDGMFSKQFRFSTLQSKVKAATELEAGQPSDAIAGSLSAPWNLTVTKNEQGWLLHWEHPQHGLDTWRAYTVRWWKEPDHFLIGSIETFDTFHQIRHLKDDASFRVQVVASNNDGDEVPSNEVIIDVPAHRKMRALLIGSSVAVFFLICALCAFLYVKRSCLLHLFAGQDDEDGSGGDSEGSVSSLEDVKVTAKMNNT